MRWKKFGDAAFGITHCYVDESTGRIAYTVAEAYPKGIWMATLEASPQDGSTPSKAASLGLYDAQKRAIAAVEADEIQARKRKRKFAA